MKYIRKQQAQRIRRRLQRLYGDRAEALMERFVMLLGRYGVGLDVAPCIERWDQGDAVLITYADMVQREGERPLVTLRRFCNQRLRGAIRTVHLLPFYPWTSDDGFSVADYRQVDERYGRWTDVEMLGGEFGLMFDLVLNHCSRSSEWFQDFIRGVSPGRHFFHRMDPQTDLSEVVRPRALPLLTKTSTRDGAAWVWTTFSEDQVDLNWENPDVLFEFLDILFLYIAKRVRILRLDAVAFLWKKVGTSCIHLKETHEVVKLFRDVLELVAPHVILLTETNVPHKENVSYFGAGDEAHMVYNFSLPPLTLHALLRGDGTHLTTWARELEALPKGTTLLNFTASHDGIGVRPLQGLLADEELDWIVGQVQERGGRVSMRRMSDGSDKPYELNITYFSALSDPESTDLGVARFLCSQAIALAFRGMPAVYFHSLVATPNWQEGVEELGHNRAINRRKYDIEELDGRLDEKGSVPNRVFERYTQMLKRRSAHAAFHPTAEQRVRDLGAAFFAFERTSTDANERLYCVFNLTAQEQRVSASEIEPSLGQSGTALQDVLAGRELKVGKQRILAFAPYQAMWILAR